ncbi:MAG: type II toxin-antitoxin system VapC family toxin [Betaproteobacteria bacterium]
MLDTCTFLWAVSEPERLSEEARQAITSAGNEAYLSAISAWEIAVKQARGGLELSEAAARYVPKYREALGLLELPLDEAAALQVARLPRAHKDPFDRMLVCQAIAHGLLLVTPDPLVAQYPVRILW